MVKITPETYIDMNKEFEEDGTPFRISIPTQEQIDEHRSQPSPPYHAPPAIDMVAEMWKKHRAKEQEESIRQLENEASDYGIGK